MDYVVAGFGIGALLALIGFALWELYGNREEPGQAWLTRASIGAMLGSLVIWAITGVTLISTLDDATASRLVMLTTLITILAIVAGTAWYWRADKALLASMPQPRAQNLSTQAGAVAAPQAPVGVELSEWDNWPAREEGSAKTGDSMDAPPAEADFAPEVAAEPEAEEPAADLAQQPESPSEAVVEAAVEEAAPDSEAMAQAEDVVLDVMVEESVDAPEPEAVAQLEDEAVDSGAPEQVAVLEANDEPAAETGATAPLEALPANIRPLRPLLPPPEGELEIVEDVETGELADSEPVDEPAEQEVLSASVEPTKPAADSNGTKVPTEPEAPVAFESSLLADIDGTAVDGDGRYRSPLLADLETNPDELEGVGLAKWPADARLTADDLETTETPKRRRRR